MMIESNYFRVERTEDLDVKITSLKTEESITFHPFMYMDLLESLYSFSKIELIRQEREEGD